MWLRLTAYLYPGLRVEVMFVVSLSGLKQRIVSDTKLKRIISFQRCSKILDQPRHDVFCLTFSGKQAPLLSIYLSSPQPRRCLFQLSVYSILPLDHIKRHPTGLICIIDMSKWHDAEVCGHLCIESCDIHANTVYCSMAFHRICSFGRAWIGL